jgi:hypothetical protein
MEEAIWTLAKGELLFTGTLNVIYGGPHSGRSKLLEIANSKVLSNYATRRTIPLSITIPPYLMPVDQMEGSLAYSIVRALASRLQNFPYSEDRTKLIDSLKVEINKKGCPEDLEWLAHDPIMPVIARKDLRLHPDLKPLNWALDIVTSATDSNNIRIQLAVEEFSRLPLACQQNLFRLSRSYGVLLAISTRSVVSTEYGQDNPLSAYLTAANYTVLDFEPRTPEFQHACKTLLERYLKKVRGTEEIRLAEDMLRPKSKIFQIAVNLSNGHIGRFIDFLRNFGVQYRRGSMPSRSMLEDFCRIGFDEIIQNEPIHELAVSMRHVVKNLKLIDSEIDPDIYSTIFNLKELFNAGSTFNPSIVRSAVLSWLFHVDVSDRIATATNTRHVPSKIKISPLAAMMGEIALSKIIV